MKAKKINLENLNDKISRLEDKDIGAVGSYLFNGFHIQISEHKLTTSERVSRLYHRRRENGLCVVCSKKVKKVNPKTKKLYRLCKEHREKIDNVDLS